MARKVRRVRRPRSEKEAAAKADTGSSTSEEDLRREYAYVIKDLRRVAILAAAMFALLILLNLILQ